jgi:imidazolonepropionase
MVLDVSGPTTPQTVVIDRIGSLITNDPQRGRGRLGIIEHASLVIEGGRVVAVGPQGAHGDHHVDAGGATVIPGFVDSHTHLVFAGDRSAEFAARMNGEPYAAGGIRTTVASTRGAGDIELRRHLAGRLSDAIRSGTTHVEIKSGYGLTVADESRCLNLASECTDDVTFLGAHVCPAEFEGRADRYIDLVCTDMLASARPTARWIDAFCEVGAFDVDQCRAVLAAGAAVGMGGRLHGNQLGHGPGVQLAVEMNCASVDHCTHVSDEDVEALGSSSTVATLLPASDFCARQPYAPARRLIDRGVTVAIASNCNPGTSFTTSMPFAMVLAVREMGMSVDEALWSATAGGAAALRRDDMGVLRPGARADFAILDAPNHVHLVYRPGMPLIHSTWIGGARRFEAR